MTLLLSHLHSDDLLLKDIVVVVVLLGAFLPFLKLFLQLEVHQEDLGVDLLEAGQEVETGVLVVVVQGLQHQDAGDDQEHVGVAALDHLPKAFVLLG